MRRPTIIATLLMLPALVLGQTSSRAVTRATGRGVDRDVRRASAEEVHALLTRDVDTLRRLWSEDFVVTNPLNEFVSASRVLALIATDTLAFQSYDRRIEYVHAHGDVIVVAGSETVVWAGHMPLAGKPSRLRFTAVWTTRGGRMQEVARHANIVLPTAPGTPPAAAP
jgi:ketosteroid isomerase-like protein